MSRFRSALLFGFCAASLVLGRAVHAEDKVVIAINPVSSALPYYVADQRGFFKDVGITTEAKQIIVPSLVIGGLIQDQIDVVGSMLAIDAANGNIKKPGTINYIALNAQSATYKMEQFAVRTGYPAKSLADLKGARIVSAPGLGNVTLAKGALAAAGLKDGDYTLDQLDMAQHINVLKSGQYDVAYTLEPGATVMRQAGVATTLQAGIIAQLVLGDANANAYVGGAGFSGDFIAKRPDVARRFAAAWSKALDFINNDPQAARPYLLKNTVTPESVVDIVPLLLFTMVDKLTPQDKVNFQKYVDFAVNMGAVSDKVDAVSYLKSY
jgi:NitT/TauT family transport system substrate-binding protein